MSENTPNPPRSADSADVEPDDFTFEDVLGWCEDCRRPLSPSDPPSPPGEAMPRACPHCLRGYDPAKPDSFRHSPPPRPAPWWRTPDAFWGYAALLSILVGRIVLNVMGDPFFTAATKSGSGAYDSSMVVQGAGAILAVVLGVGLVLPWVFVTVYLVLIATEHLGEGLPLTFAIGIFTGVVLFWGFPGGWLLAGGMLGGFAGVVKRWRELRV